MESFTASIKRELVRLQDVPDCCRWALLTSLVRLSGRLSMTSEGPLLRVSTENPGLARCLFHLLKEKAGYAPQIRVRRKAQLHKNWVYVVQQTRGLPELLAKLEISPEQEIWRPVTNVQQIATCCCRAYLRGTFLGASSVSHPEKSSYHLEIVVACPHYTASLMELMQRLQLAPRILQRRRGSVLYIKEAEQISTFLSLIGAHSFRLIFENARIYKEVRNSVNRVVNCETANLNKTVRAAMRQVENIALIDRLVGLHTLSPPLREMAELRRHQPELSLGEIAALMPSGPVSKSAVNHRLRKLEALADQLRVDEGQSAPAPPSAAGGAE